MRPSSQLRRDAYDDRQQRLLVAFENAERQCPTSRMQVMKIGAM